MKNTPLTHSELDNDRKIKIVKNSSSTNYKSFFYHVIIEKQDSDSLPEYNSINKIDIVLDYITIKNEFLAFLKHNFNELVPQFGFIKLDELLVLLKNFFHSNYHLIKEEIDFSNFEHQITLFWAYLTGLNKLLPLLLDKHVEEIFISPNTEKVFIDHYLEGRMSTNILISEKEKENLLYRTAMENNLEINQMKPSIKGDLQVPGLFALRITGDIKPFSYDGTIMNIRKLHQREFTLQTLIKLNSIDPLTGAFLKTLITTGINFTIIGSPSSGKTTLQNALLRELPIYWRIFSFENTLETNIKKSNFFRFKIYDYLKGKNNDLLSIFSQLLHRSPDYVNLGEITTAEEALGWNACMSAGIPIIQTIHSNSSYGLLDRIKEIFNIPLELFASSFPHIIVEVKYFWKNFRKERRVFSVSELIVDNINKVNIKQIAKFSYKNDNLSWIIDPIYSETFKWIQENKNRDILNVFKENFQKYKEL